jgi:hypothetical protein
MSSSKKMSLLNCVNWASCTSSGLVSVYFSIFQNSIGLYFRMLGRSNYSFALWFLHRCLNCA